MTDQIDWDLAVGVADQMSGTGDRATKLGTSYHRDILAQNALEMVPRAEGLVQEETSLTGVSTPGVLVVDRKDWARRNLLFFARLLVPMQEELDRRFEESKWKGKLSRRWFTLETGAIMGLLSRRVLGQYELVLPSGSNGDDIYLVAPNILAMEREHQFRPSEFRFWICLHEVTHRLQFIGVPWLQSYFMGLVEEMVGLLFEDELQIATFLKRIKQAASQDGPIIGESGLPGLVASPELRSHMDRMQALMSLLEGHGHVVMDRIGERHLVTCQRMSKVLSGRRKNSKMPLLMRLTGMEMKLRQYELGASFIARVEEKAGWGTLNLVWESPEALPTLEQIKNPDLWLARVA